MFLRAFAPLFCAKSAYDLVTHKNSAAVSNAVATVVPLIM